MNDFNVEFDIDDQSIDVDLGNIQIAETTDHRYLSHRSDSDQHPISAITNLQSELDSKGTYSKPAGGIPDSDITSASVWNAKGNYSKPADGIPSTDMTLAVQTSLEKADSALQSVPATYRTASAQDVIDGTKINTSAIQTSVSSASTDSQVPSAKLFYDTIGNVEAAINTIRGVSV